MQKKAFTSIEQIKRKLERYCVYQDRCHSDIEKKLYEYDLILEVKTQVILHLIEHDFLNEERFARSFARGKFRIKYWGRQRIIRELRQRDISSYNIKQAMLEIDQKDYLTTLYAISEKKLKELSDLDKSNQKVKLIRYLQYRGYEFELIFKVADELIVL